MNISRFCEEHQWETMMAMLELEGFLLAMDATLDCLVMLQIRGVL
jgi:hypothetical protein